MWRPEGWENPFPKTKIVKLVSGKNHKKLDERNYYYEAGADAMMEALKTGNPLMNPEQMKLLTGDREYPYGWLVFIPEG